MKKFFLLFLAMQMFVLLPQTFAKSIFKIGFPDAKAAEFKNFEDFNKTRFYIEKGTQPYKESQEFFSKPFVFFPQEQTSEKFPYVQPLANCEWADIEYGNRITKPEKYYSHELFYNRRIDHKPFILKFDLPEIPKSDLYLKIGFIDKSLIIAPIKMDVKINAQPLKTFTVPFKYDAKKNPYPCFANILGRPKTWGRPVCEVIKIPVENLLKGENSIELSINSKSVKTRMPLWVAYDFIELDESDSLPNVEDPYQAKKQEAIANADFEEIVFSLRKLHNIDGHWYANIGGYVQTDMPMPSQNMRNTFCKKLYAKDGGKLLKFNIKNGSTNVMLNSESGSIRNPSVHYDAKKIIFSYRPDGKDNYSLYEIDTNGKNLKKLNFGEDGYDDIEPCYLPNDDIVFVSTRCKRVVPCWAVDVAILHRYFKDEKVVRPISANVDQDNTPSPTSDGRLIYMKWEYVQKNQLNFHSLWKKDQNGANDMIFFGNNDLPYHLLISPRQIGEQPDYIATWCIGHGGKDHSGRIIRISNPKSPGDLDAFEFITGEDLTIQFASPYPIDDNYTLCSDNSNILLIDRMGHIFALDIPPEISEDISKKFSIREPVAIRKTKRGMLVQNNADYEQNDANVVIINAAIGRNMGEIKNSDIKKLLILEVLPTSNHMTGGMEPITLGGTFNIERVLGVVDVEDDGSAHFKVPSNTPISFVLLDKDAKAIKRMQSFTNFIQGTTTSCIGCHEPRDMAPPPIKTKLKALTRPAQPLEPIYKQDEVIDYVRDIQPILNKHCVSCHNPKDYASKLDLSEGMGPMFAKSYFNLRVRRQISDGLNRDGNMPPYSFGSGASKLIGKLDGSHNKVKISDAEMQIVKFWLDMGAPQASSGAAAEAGLFGIYYNNNLTHPDADWKERECYNKVIEKKCASCHKGNNPNAGDKFLPKFISGDMRDRTPWHWLFYIDKNNPRNRLAHHAVFNLTTPQNSSILLTPLDSKFGGRASPNAHSIIFASDEDEDYKKILTYIQKASDDVKNNNPRYNLKSFKPNGGYLYMMQRYGILDANASNFVDAFECDKRYWNLLKNSREKKYK